MRRIKQRVKECLNIIVNIYMVLIIAVMPFYFTNGYGRIGSDKYDFFYKVTTKVGAGFLAVWGIYLLLGLPELVQWRKNQNHIEKRVAAETFANRLKEKLRWLWKEKLSLTDRFVLLYGGALILSYLHTDYREMTAVGDSFKGATGWYMGFSTQMLFLAVYFGVSRFWRSNKVLPALWIPVGFAVFLLGYCNRFSFRPIKMAYANEAFISTIGNINWYCGYVVTVFFGILYFWWSGVEKNKWTRGVLLTVCAIGFGTLITQGSNSGHVTLAVLCLVFYLLFAKDGEKMQRFWMMIALFGGTLTLTALLRLMLPEKFSSADRVTRILTYSVVPVLLLVLGLVMWKLVADWNHNRKYPRDIFIKIGKYGVLAGTAVLGLVLLLILINTKYPGSLGRLSQVPLFTFNARWGSSRGATYMAGIQTWLDQNFLGKLLGVGPDSMAMYIHSGSNPELLAMTKETFGGNILTNAHCEWLTILADVGVLGLIGFGGMIVTAIRRYIKADQVLITACGMGILAYTVNNLFSFQQAMGTTTMFLILGMGEAFYRERYREGTYHGKK